jgi:hypothetical protein
MVSITFTAIAVGALITTTIFIHPASAAPAVIIGIGCAFIPASFTALVAGAAIEVSHQHHKRDLPICPCPTHLRFSACPGDEATRDTNITIHINNKQSIIVDGLSPACIAQVQEYNAQPDPKGLDGEGDGTMTVLNDTTIQIDGLPEKFVKKYFEAHNITTAS